MQIGLIDVDSHNFPNLALMKISAYHKMIGDKVEWCVPMMPYDLIYQSKIFDHTPDFTTVLQAKEVRKGGRAYDKKKVLPQEIETMYPDYDLHNIKNIAYGYLSRGCPRACPFCDVVNIEGRKAYKVADLDQFWKGQKEIVLLDPNLLATKEHPQLLQQLIDSKAHVDFTQGLDARLLTDANIDLISRVKIKMIHFAWDMLDQSDLILDNLKRFKAITNINDRKARVYVLTNYNTTIEQDLYRIYTLRDIGYDPYVMTYDKGGADKQRRRMARWVNNKFIWRTCNTFEEYTG